MCVAGGGGGEREREREMRFIHLLHPCFSSKLDLVRQYPAGKGIAQQKQTEIKLTAVCRS